jgi:hypothetical protein
MSWLNTSIHSGFARSASEAMFPRLFPDACWLCPSLNPAMGGTRLWDLSGGQNWGTLTNMANDDWVVSGGKYALDFDGSNDFVSAEIPLLSGSLLFSIWARGVAGNASTNYIASIPIVSAGSNGIDFRNPTNAQANLALVGSFVTINSGVDIRGSWNHLVLGYRSGLAFFFVNGILVGSQSWPNGISSLSSRQLNLGRFGSFGSHSPVQIDDVRLYSRGLTDGEIRQLYQIGRGNMPIRRRRRCVEQAAGGFKAYWANRQHLIGSGVY